MYVGIYAADVGDQFVNCLIDQSKACQQGKSDKHLDILYAIDPPRRNLYK
ncbi:MAG: hypothetical protein JKY67_04385 [Pseudomonadales bacterium]|nr:hypothetical protein [Pseudomonadales bacterium]